MESLDTVACLVEDLLNFSSDVGEEDEEDHKPNRALASSLKPNGLLGPADSSIRPYHEFADAEEELEWISNKDAFPAVESFADILSGHPSSGVIVSKLHSPVSVLEGGITTTTSSSNSNSNNSSSSATITSCFDGVKAPRRARSKRRGGRRRGNYADLTGRQLCWSQANSHYCSSKRGNGNSVEAEKAKTKTKKTTTTATIGRKCQHCGAEKTPQWRAGPYGPKTLCNACGVRYKSGRLVAEYRPASSPTFSGELHSNSHRKIIEMRRLKQMMGMVVKHPLESG